MRWFSIRRTEIDPELRKTFERYGTVGMQIALGDMNHFVHQGQTMKAQGRILDSLLAWLTEQYDRTDRKETWSLTMEIAITVFVLGELIFDFTHWH
jgi:hypothetical protein